MSEILHWSWLGRVDYDDVGGIFEAARADVLGGGHERLYLCEHGPVITLGRHANEHNITSAAEALAQAGVKVRQTDRGGDVTYHGPGQLMVYPVLRIGLAVADYSRRIAGALAGACTELGGAGAQWTDDPPGLWWRGRKLAACGMRIHRGVLTHGFALNVCTPADAWSHIVPCGLADRSPVSLQEILSATGGVTSMDVATVAPIVARHLAVALGRDPVSQG